MTARQKILTRRANRAVHRPVLPRKNLRCLSEGLSNSVPEIQNRPSGMERKVWQQCEFTWLCERLHIQCVHASLHEQAYNCARVNFNMRVREREQETKTEH